MKFKHLFTALAFFTFAATGCNSSGGSEEEAESDNQQPAQEIYEAQLTALNSSVTGQQTSGVARFVVEGDVMKVTIDVKDAPAGIEHWQHFHGFPDDMMAECASAAQDVNGDGVIDVVETEPASGTTMVPFNELPAKMEIGSNTYPIASGEGSYHYEAEIPMADLKATFSKAFGEKDLNLDHRVLYVHGIAENTQLPETVASLGDIPAHVTLPIACGKIVKTQ